MDNIAQFDRFAARILSDLYASFPAKITLDIDDYLEVASQADVFCATADFLLQEGFIRYDAYYGSLVDAVLTAKGLSTLDKPAPELLADHSKGSIGKRLGDLAKLGQEETLRAAIRALFSVFG